MMASRGGSKGSARAARTGRSTAARRPAPRTGRARRESPWQALLEGLGRHPDRTAAALIALVVLGYLWPVLVGGKVFAATSALYVLAPWQHLVPSDILSYFNFTLTDVPTADYPWRFLAREMIHEGTFPAWNPHVFAGAPFYSNPQTGIFSLFSLPLWILPLDYGIGVGAALKLWAAGFGTYLLVRELKLGFLPGLLAGVGFAFCALNIVWLTHETLPAVAAMLPWVIWAIERLFARGGVGNAIALAVATAIGLGGGHPGMQLHLLAAAGIYALVRAALPREEDASGRWGALALAGAGLTTGALLMAFMLLPEALSSRGTLGTVARRGGEGTLPGSTMPFDAIKTVLWPDWWGRPSAREVGAGPNSAATLVNYNERTFYAGVVVLLLAFVSLAGREGWRRKAPFIGLATVGLAIPLHAPGLYWLATHLPFFRDVQSQRMHFIFAFGVAVLAAFGLRAVLDRPAGDRWRFAVPAAALLVGVVAAVAAGTKPGDLGRTIEHFTTGADFARRGVVALTAVGWFGLFVVGVGVALLVARRWPRLRSWAAVAIVLLAVADAYHFAAGYQPMAPAEQAIPPEPPVISFLQKRADEGRIVGLEYTLVNDWSLVYGLRDVRGYDPPQPTLRFYRLWLAANPAQANWQPFKFDELTPKALRVMSVLGARYVVAAPETRVPRGRDSALQALEPVYRGRDAVVFRNDRAVERAVVAEELVVTGSEAHSRAMLVSEGFDPRRMAVLETREATGVGLSSGASSRGTVEVTRDENARVELNAILERPGVVVLNDHLTEGWSVEVDGREAAVLRVNDVMRGVRVAAGRHEIRWSYTVPGLRAGIVISLAALGLVLGTVLVPRLRPFGSKDDAMRQ